MRRIMLAGILVMLSMAGIAYGELSCQVEQTSCSSGYSDILHMSNSTNAHAELANESNYDYKLCCKDTGEQGTSISSSCSGTTYLKLSDSTDAHVEKATESNYTNNACVYSADATFNCGYQSSNCNGWDTCMASISGDDNAHIADCTTDPYTTRVCCNMTYTNTEPTITSISDSPDPIKGGTTINITTSGVSDGENDTLSLYCGTTATPDSGSTVCTGGTTSDDPAYNLDCTFTVQTDDTSHTIYCRLYDGEYYSSAVSTTYTTDSTPPSSVSVENVDGDTSSPYWDSSDNSQTIIQANRPDSGMLCRWGTSDVPYSSMSNDCTMGTDSTQCNLGDLSEASSYTYHISCTDAVGNEQSNSQNTDITFGVDWSDPTTSIGGYGGYYKPGHNVTIIEDDNIGTTATIQTWECHPNSGCSPTTLVDDGSKVMFTSRGTNYIRWYSQDEAQNDQAQQEVQVVINSLPVITDGDMLYGIGSGYTGRNGGRVYFYCDGTDANGAVSGNNNYSARIWLRHSTSGTWNIASGDTMAWSESDGRFQYDHLLDDNNDIYGTTYDMMCEITDDLGEGTNHTKNSIFDVVNTPPYADEITVNDSNAQKYDHIRWFCSGADADTPTHQESTLTAKFWLRTQGAGEWDLLENVTMTWGGTDHYYDLQVLQDGGTHYDARCQLTDGVDHSNFYDEFQTEYDVVDDWDGDGVADSSDTIEGSGSNLNTSDTVTILVSGSEQNTSSGSQSVEFEEGGEAFVKFNWDFDSADLETPFITVDRVSTGNRGGVVVSGLTGVEKSLRVPKLLGSGTICLKNSSVTSVDEISSGCSEPDEILFTNCAGGQTIGGITCTDNGTYYEVSGVIHSASTEFGSSRLEIWSEPPYWQHGNVSFYANYTNSTSNATITSADCEIYFSDTGWDDMNFNSVEWEYQRVFTSEGQRTYEVNCTHASYTDLHTTDDFTITTSAIPEFSLITVMLAISAIIGALVLMRRKK